MVTLMRFAQSGRFLLPFVAAIFLPLSVSAQPQLVVSPDTPINVQANTGSNAPSQTRQISNGGNRALKWTVQENASWLSVSPATGVNTGTVTFTFQTSGLAPGPYQTTVSVTSNGGSRDIPVQVTINSGPPPPPPTLTVSCPANISVTSSNGSPVVVNYTPTTSGGVPPVNVTVTPLSGSSFPVGTTTVQVDANSSDGQTASCSFTVTVTNTTPPAGVDISASPTNPAPGSAVTVSFSGIANPTPKDWIALAPAGSALGIYQDWKYAGSCAQSPGIAKASGSCPFTAPSTAGNYEFRLFANDVLTLLDSVTVTVGTTEPPPPPPPPPPATGVGPQSTITCPAGAVDIVPGVSIQTMININPGATTFCLRAGVHSLSRSIVPKTGNTFVGEFGAILDGTGWTSTDGTESAFRAFNQDIDFVTIRNLVIRNMPQGGIHAFHLNSDHWTVEFNEIANNGGSGAGVHFVADSLIRNNYIHHNSHGGFIGLYAHNSIVENNEVAFNGREQKVGEANNVTVRNNFFHHNVGNGVWYDGSNTGALIEGNRIEDNGGSGIHYEISRDAIIRNNIVRRSGEIGVFISTSKNVQVYNNTLDSNFRGIFYFVSCSAVVAGGPIGWDLTNNTAHDNSITVGTQNGAIASGFSYTGDCTSAQLSPYMNGSKNITLSNNTYDVPSPNTVTYFYYWGVFKFWSEWHQALSQDIGSTIQ